MELSESRRYLALFSDVIVIPFIAGTVFRRQNPNLTYIDVRFWRLKMVTALEEIKF